MRIVFMGTPEAAVPTLQRCLEDGHQVVAVWTQPDKPAGRGKKVTQPPVKTFALAQNLEVYQPARIKTDEAKQLFVSHRADVALVVAYGRILPAEYLSTPRRGCINVHFSLLPLYRGAAPVNWAIINGEYTTGVTTMFIEEELDSGPLLLQRRMEIGAKETAPELMSRLSHLGADLLSETLSNLGAITPRPQHDRDATFAPLLQKEDGLIRWSSDAFMVERLIRGLQPWPNAFTELNSRRLVIWQAEPIRMDVTGDAGAVVAARGDELLVKCGGDTALRIIEIQAEGGRRMLARDFLNGFHINVGDKLGTNR
ncbi:MAG TPA: methionyl-tRNA formyltransferase [Pyrinomonadaceae bacterium]|nr:methionyl-tRNA formyltransferase [Pyrinomonadaceae bacterium]